MLLFPSVVENSLLANQQLRHVSEKKIIPCVHLLFSHVNSHVRIKKCLMPEGTNVTCSSIILQLSFESSAFQLFSDSVKCPSDYLSKK